MPGKLKRGLKIFLMHMASWVTKESKEIMMMQDRAPRILSKTSETRGKTKEDSSRIIKEETPSPTILAVKTNFTEISTATSITSRQAIDKLIRTPTKEMNRTRKLTRTSKNFSRGTKKILRGPPRNMKR